MKLTVSLLAASTLLAQAGFVPSPHFDTDPPQLPDDLKPGGVLIFSKTNGFRDEPAMQASTAALVAIAKTRNWPVFATENGAVMNAGQLGKFKVVIWNNTSGDTLNADQRAAFKTWLELEMVIAVAFGNGGDDGDVVAL